MARPILALLLLSLQIIISTCEMTKGRAGYGLIGYGIDMYDPECAYSCYDVLSSSALNCSTVPDGEMNGMSMDVDTSPECYVSDDIFLQSLGWCLHSYCDGQVPVYKLEEWWLQNVAGRQSVQPSPKLTYQQALARVTETPNVTIGDGNPLEQTSLVAYSDYISNRNAQVAFENQEITHERYGLVVLLCGFVIPIGFSLLRFVPFPKFLVTKFNAWIVDPPFLGRHHAQPIIFGLVQVPTRGQGLFIAYLLLLNFLLCAVNYRSVQPNSWFPNGRHDEILTYVTNRMGVLSFANLPLVFLYAGRNNVLLYLTNWSHSTFILLHRWVAYIATLQAVLHSAVWLQNYLATDSYSSDSKLPYWYWGVIATLAMSILLPSSILPIRHKLYELFLVWHIVLSVLVMAGCYLHIYYRFEHQWGYELWIIITMAIWGFDRVMRFLRLARNGVRTAQITPIDEDYIRVDIEGLSGMGHAYLYFPFLTWRVWENHPFSVAATLLPAVKEAPTKDLEAHPSSDASSPEIDTKDPSTDIHEVGSPRSHLPPRVGLTFLVRTRGGLTSKFPRQGSIPVLVESMYGQHADLLDYPSLVCIAGGVGVTAVLPYLQTHLGVKKLYWGVRNERIVKATEINLLGIDKEVFVGTRMVVREVIEDALSKSGAGVAVVVSGPAGLADEVRVAVSEAGKKGGRKNIKLVDESFAW